MLQKRLRNLGDCRASLAMTRDKGLAMTTPSCRCEADEVSRSNLRDCEPRHVGARNDVSGVGGDKPHPYKLTY